MTENGGGADLMVRGVNTHIDGRGDIGTPSECILRPPPSYYSLLIITALINRSTFRVPWRPRGKGSDAFALINAVRELLKKE